MPLLHMVSIQRTLAPEHTVATDLLTPVRELVAQHPQIEGVIFADLDGQEISLHPPTQGESLRHCAIFSGIALRRLTVAERLAGRNVVREVNLQGSEGAVMAMMVADENQLVVTITGDQALSHLAGAVRRTVKRLEGLSR
jgi:predicted regulator of Ras-like GTPase activity (Roadblock/LC7/MglB family)